MWARFAKGERYFFENVDGANLDQGEWFQNGSRIEYMPTDLETALFKFGRMTAILPCLPVLVQISDGAHDLRVEKLGFIHSGDNRWGWGQTAAQASIGPDTSAAIEVAAAERVTFANIEIAKIAGYGVHIGDKSQNIAVVDSRLHDLGGGGIFVGSIFGNAADPSTWPANPKERATRSHILHNLIYDGGLISYDAEAIWVGDVGGNEIVDNDISNFRYTAISVGWNWAGSKIARNNRIESNRISHIGLGVLSDLAGIYTTSDLSGTVIRDNEISDVRAGVYGGFGIYLDRDPLVS